MQETAENLIETADQCIRLARAGREMADNLEAMSRDLMARAVEIDTYRQRQEQARGTGGAGG